MKYCPCGSKKRYLDCCGLYLVKKAFTETPETLMRSRYTAFVEGDISYIQKTMQGAALANFNKKEAKRKVEWLRLEVLNTSIDSENSSIGYVEFKAHYRHNKQSCCIHENSEFHYIDNRWYYVGEKL